MTSQNVLFARGLSIDAPGGRPLIRGLDIVLAHGDRVAVVGRNGVGKSSLVAALAGESACAAGIVRWQGRVLLVPQALTGIAFESPGQVRLRRLREAFDAQPSVLLLDEPTHDLDQTGMRWLAGAVQRFTGTLLVVSHDRRLLRQFQDFFVVAESGCTHMRGDHEVLLQHLDAADARKQEAYRRKLAHLAREEQRSDNDRNRRDRKKRLGRVHELKRCPARAQLNGKRSYAQEKQARRRLLRAGRIADKRDNARALRRALAVKLPLHLLMPSLALRSEAPASRLEQVAAFAGERPLFAKLSLSLSRERIAVLGDNGTGKSTLAALIAGEREPQVGTAQVDRARIGYVAQHSRNWQLEESVLDVLMQRGRLDLERALAILDAHRFPQALGCRPLRSLSPGERLRAALICLCQRDSVPELLILDEPTDYLDLTGMAAFETFVKAWPGGLVLISHDEDFLERARVDGRITLGAEV